MNAEQFATLGRDIDSMPPDCTKHPRYKAVYPPRVACGPCQDMYDWVHCQSCTNEALCGKHGGEAS